MADGAVNVTHRSAANYVRPAPRAGNKGIAKTAPNSSQKAR
jgi:hypothetical protein